jgi:hypothetical protein
MISKSGIKSIYIKGESNKFLGFHFYEKLLEEHLILTDCIVL